MSPEEQKKVIRELLKSQSLAVLSTIDSVHQKPESAILEYSETNNLEIIFDTFSNFRKYKNLETNQNVSLVIRSSDNHIGIQYEGIAKELRGKELEEGKGIHVKKLPEASKFGDMEEIRFFKVIPTWIRYSDVSVDPWLVFELNAF